MTKDKIKNILIISYFAVIMLVLITAYAYIIHNADKERKEISYSYEECVQYSSWNLTREMGY